MGLKHNILQLIRRNESVLEGVPNRVFEQIHENVRYLSDVIEAAATGSTIFARSVSVEADALVGMPVYYNPDTQQFERALGATRTDATTGLLLTAPSADVWGVVHTKHNSTLADLLLYGYASLDISNAVDVAVAAGTYYLSGVTAGKMTRSRPPLAVPVLRSDGAGNVFVCPNVVDFLDRHVHYHFSLSVVPAGETTPPSPGGRHSITDADDDLPGWLPADHASFDGKAPAGAAFGYNLAAHPQLLAVWPPLPTGNAQLVWDKGLSIDVGGTNVPLGSSGLCVIDRHGVWWMSDCYGDVPWPVDYDSSSPESYSDSASVECPRHLDMRLDLWFSRVNFATDVTSVTSLRSNDARVKVRCYGTDDLASTGDLEVTLDFSMSVTDEDALGGQVLKELNDGNTFKRGWAVEGIYSESENVTVTGTHSRPLDPDDEDSQEIQQGVVQIEVAPASVLELPTELVRLDGVSEEYLFDLMYLAFAQGEQSALRGKIRVPTDIGIASPQLALRLRILGRTAGTLPDLTVTARRVARNDPADTPLALPTSGSEFTVDIDTGVSLVTTNTYVEAESEPFEVAAGDLVFFSIERSDSDGYNGEVGMLQMTGSLTGAS
jgi:hypothetical protein